MAKPSKQVRKQRKTLLAMGEGKADAAFLAHLRKLARSRIADLDRVLHLYEGS
jgi:hypothetical protein